MFAAVVRAGVVKVSVYIAKHPGEDRALSLVYWPTYSAQFMFAFLCAGRKWSNGMLIVFEQPHPTTSQIHNLQKAVLSFLALINDADPG